MAAGKRELLNLLELTFGLSTARHATGPFFFERGEGSV